MPREIDQSRPVRTVAVDWDGDDFDDRNPLPTGSARLTTAFAYDGADNLIYAGRAAIGSAKSAAVWQIKKFTYSGTNLTDEQWAGGTSAFDKVWNDRASLSYS